MRTDWKNAEKGDILFNTPNSWVPNKRNNGKPWTVGKVNLDHLTNCTIQLEKDDGTIGNWMYMLHANFAGFEKKPVDTTPKSATIKNMKLQKITDFQVGDVVTQDGWGGENHAVHAINAQSNEIIIRWNGEDFPYSVSGGGFRIVSRKTPIAKTISFIIAGDGTINAHVNGKNYVMPHGSMFYAASKQALKDKDADAFVEQCNLEQGLRQRSNGKITLENGVVMWNGQAVHNALVDRIYKLIEQDFPFEPMLAFLENTLKNPSQKAVDELYLFLQANALPITEDGCFLAYRRVGADYLSIHPNPDGSRNSNKVGETVNKSRSECDDDRNETCSRGLHFCSIEYLPSYPGEHTMIVKINPADIVSIPYDYNNQKGRCCKYVVVDEYQPNDDKDVLNDIAVYSVTPQGITPCDTRKNYLKQARDAFGRFFRK